MMYDETRFNWQNRDDADTLKRYQEIKSDPVRFAKAQEFIADSVDKEIAVLADKPISPVSTVPRRRENRATIGTLPVPR